MTRFRYLSVKQAILAVVRIYGPVTARVALHYTKTLVTIKDLDLAMLKGHLERLEAAKLVSCGPLGWSARPSAVGIMEAA